ncbi:MAG: GNAT family N-acetyltransferase [Chlorobaculum sp.]
MPTVRIAEPADIDACTRLLNVLFSQEHEFAPDLKKQEAGLGMIIGDSSAGTIFVCEADERIIGMVSLLNLVSTALGKKVAMLEDMIVDPEWRAQLQARCCSITPAAGRGKTAMAESRC